ncbi:MAG: 1-acyl-sn-glycerol-3-phosphate acyltransferase [Streptosporangiales bacterium]|nr:1-acyl-sn-glycerol-3-phosphate acyltransferase [Streptosporangiales bacterium]
MRRGPSTFWTILVVAVLRPLLFLLIKRDWRGQQNIPRSGGLIIVANHLSYADPLAVAHYLYEHGRWPVYLAKSSLFEKSFLGSVLRGCGQIPVYRQSTDAALALRDAEKGVREGACVIFYPEGTATRDPNLWPMVGKTGAVRLAIDTGAPVIPLAHWGAHELLPYGEKKPRLFPRKTMRIVAGPPADLSRYREKGTTAENLRAATADVMGSVTALLADLRGEEPPAKPFDPRAAARESGATGDAGATDERRSA